MELDSPDETLPTRKQAAPRPDDPTMRVRTVRYERERATPDEATAKVSRVRLGRGWGYAVVLLLVMCAAAAAWVAVRR